MKSTVLGKGIAVKMAPMLFAFGADPEPKDPPKLEPVSEFKAPNVTRVVEDDDDEDDDHFDDKKDRKIAKLSRENNKRRIANRNKDAEIAARDEEIRALRAELKKAEKLQTAYQDLKTARDSEQDNLKNMAILRAIEKDKDAEGNPRAWYDVPMVQGLLDRDQIAVDTSDFSVGGLEDQLSKIAEEKPYLVKQAEKSDSQDRTLRTPSGHAPQSSATGNPRENESANEGKMRADFPALQGLI